MRQQAHVFLAAALAVIGTIRAHGGDMSYAAMPVDRDAHDFGIVYAATEIISDDTAFPANTNDISASARESLDDQTVDVPLQRMSRARAPEHKTGPVSGSLGDNSLSDGLLPIGLTASGPIPVFSPVNKEPPGTAAMRSSDQIQWDDLASPSTDTFASEMFQSRGEKGASDVFPSGSKFGSVPEVAPARPLAPHPTKLSPLARWAEERRAETNRLIDTFIQFLRESHAAQRDLPPCNEANHIGSLRAEMKVVSAQLAIVKSETAFLDNGVFRMAMDYAAKVGTMNWWRRWRMKKQARSLRRARDLFEAQCVNTLRQFTNLITRTERVIVLGDLLANRMANWHEVERAHNRVFVEHVRPGRELVWRVNEFQREMTAGEQSE